MPVTPLVLGLNSNHLSKDEVIILTEINPYGLILFNRNIVNHTQLKKLISDIRDKVREDIHILIDQEGGTIQRLKEPYWKRYPSYRQIGQFYMKSPESAKRLSYIVGRLIACDLKDLHIDINCAPCIDVRHQNTSQFLVDRIFSSDFNIVYQLALEMIKGFQHEGVVPILKHIPGHGRSSMDSHLELPTIHNPLEDLMKVDFEPFKKLNKLPIAMTAHITYSAIDNLPVTISKKMLKLIRTQLAFDGLIITDDINMRALTGSRESRVIKSLEAGCDLILDCSGKNNMYVGILNNLPHIDLNIIDSGVNEFKSVQKDEDFQNIDTIFEEYCSILNYHDINIGV